MRLLSLLPHILGVIELRHSDFWAHHEWCESGRRCALRVSSAADDDDDAEERRWRDWSVVFAGTDS